MNNIPFGYLPGSDGRRPSTTSRLPYTGNGHPGLRAPSLDNTTYILTFLVVLIPVIFTIILCIITYCIYRRNKRRSPTNATIVSTERSRAPLATIIYNSQHSPYIFEESPPAYDLLTETKKDPQGPTTHTNEQLSFTNINEEVTASAPIPTAPLPPPSPPPIYANIDESKRNEIN